jgi:hypothetical protein
MNRNCISLILFLFSTLCLKAQQNDSAVVSNWGVGVGIPHLYFRDQVSSSLAYKGLGFFQLQGIYFREKQQVIQQVQFDLSVCSSKPTIHNRPDWNSAATSISFDLSDVYLRRINKTTSKNNITKYFIGGRVSSNAIYTLFPVQNNLQAYSVNLISIALAGALAYQPYSGKNKFYYQLAIPFIGLNVRPLSFVGTIAQEQIWDQDGNVLKLFVHDPQLASFHNAITINSLIAYQRQLKKNSLRVSYAWNYEYNTVSVNTLNRIASSVTLTYNFHSKARIK